MIKGLAKASLKHWMSKELREKFSAIHSLREPHALSKTDPCTERVASLAKHANPYPLAEGVSLSETVALSPKTSLEVHLLELG